MRNPFSRRTKSGQSKSRKAKRRAQRTRKSSNKLCFEKLEERNLLAGMYLNPANGDLTIWGGSTDDVGRIEPLGTTQLRASLTGLPTTDFTKSEVSRVIFIGHQGNDRFVNNSGVAGLLYGNDGNDELFGGDAIDVIVGANGDDIIEGRGDDDRLIGGDGADQIRGGDGADKIFGNAGINEIQGDNGDDLIFGGDDSDTIHGNAGNDTILGLGGDDFLFSGTGGVEGAADLIIGHAGNDTFTGTSGLEIFYGSNGDDIMFGGSGENRMHGQNGNDVLNGGSGNDLLWGQLGDDEINGDTGNDFLNGGHNDDILRGGSGNDRILGEIGHDSLYGESGVDVLEGGSGNDGLFAGTASTERSLFGGSGNDRFLLYANDLPADFGAGDATITFRNNGSTWNDAEIEIADIGLRQLHHRTSGTNIFVDPLDVEPMALYKVPAGSLGSNVDGFNRLNWSASWEADGTIIEETYTRTIEIVDWDENDQERSEDMSLVVIHEIAHSWDSQFEIQQVVPSRASIWNTFLSRSGWETFNPGSGHTRAPAQTQEPFDRTYVAPNYEINTHTWWRDSSAEFSRNYGTTNPKEDWATTWESLFVEAIVENPHNGHATQVPSKVALVNSLLDSL